MHKTLHYIFYDAELHDHSLIVDMKTGVHITPEHNSLLKDIANTHFKDRPFVYLTHRKNSYSVDPSVYLETTKIKNMGGFGVIADVQVSGANAQIEKLFLNKPL